MENNDTQFDYQKDAVELREKKEGGGMWWVWILVILVIIVIGAFMLFGGESGPFMNGINDNEDVRTSYVTVDDIDLAIQESFPVQVAAEVSGRLEDQCTQVADVSQFRDGNFIYVTIAGEKIENCEAGGELEPVSFVDTITIESVGLPAGTYTVNVNGVEDAFTLEADNAVDMQAGEQK